MINIDFDLCTQYIFVHLSAQLLQSFQWSLTLCNPKDCSLRGSSVLGILQARILEWVAMPSPQAHPSSKSYIWAQKVENPPAMRETQVRSLGGEDPLEEEMAIHSSILAWRIL